MEGAFSTSGSHGNEGFGSGSETDSNAKGSYGSVSFGSDSNSKGSNGSVGFGCDSNSKGSSSSDEEKSSQEVIPVFLPNGERGCYASEEREIFFLKISEETAALANLALDFYNKRASKRKRDDSDSDGVEDEAEKFHEKKDDAVNYVLDKAMLMYSIPFCPLYHHINFTAKPEGAPSDSPPKLFFAELADKSYSSGAIYVTCCCTIPQPGDSDYSTDTVLNGCFVCPPNDGYRIYHPFDGFHCGRCDDRSQIGFGTPFPNEESEGEEGTY